MSYYIIIYYLLLVITETIIADGSVNIIHLMHGPEGNS